VFIIIVVVVVIIIIIIIIIIIEVQYKENANDSRRVDSLELIYTQNISSADYAHGQNYQTFINRFPCINSKCFEPRENRRQNPGGPRHTV
jgi:uncharacterized membrane protein